MLVTPKMAVALPTVNMMPQTFHFLQFEAHPEPSFRLALLVSSLTTTTSHREHPAMGRWFATVEAAVTPAGMLEPALIWPHCTSCHRSVCRANWPSGEGSRGHCSRCCTRCRFGSIPRSRRRLCLLQGTLRRGLHGTAPASPVRKGTPLWKDGGRYQCYG